MRDSQGPWAAMQSIGRKLREVAILFRIQYAEVRDEWVWVVLLASVFPLITMMFFRFFSPDPSFEMKIQLLVGNVIFGLIIMGVNMCGQEIARQREEGHFQYCAALPISRIHFVMAMFLRGLLTCLPSLLILGILGQWVFGISIPLTPGLILVVLLSLMVCVCLGNLIGFLTPSASMGSLIAQSLMMFLSFLTPVLMPMEQLPAIFRSISRWLPTTYIAESLRILFTEGWNGAVMQNILILTAFVIIGIYFISRRLDWRIEQ